MVVSRQDMKLLEVLAGRVRDERREEEVLVENLCTFSQKILMLSIFPHYVFFR